VEIDSSLRVTLGGSNALCSGWQGSGRLKGFSEHIEDLCVFSELPDSNTTLCKMLNIARQATCKLQ
jgi:hypothetical protein